MTHIIIGLVLLAAACYLLTSPTANDKSAISANCIASVLCIAAAVLEFCQAAGVS
jgi:hypothetical protein